MTKFAQVSARDLIKILRRIGFDIVSQKGSHIKLRKLRPVRKTIIIPNHKIIRPGTLKNILNMMEMTREELQKLLRQ